MIVALRSRLPVVLAVAFVGLLLVLGARRYGDVPHAWQALRVPSQQWIFSDARVVTYPIDCVLAGKDPYDRSVCSPMNGIYNYPSVWLDLRYLGLTSRSSVGFGLTLVGMYIVALLALFRAERWVSAAVVFLGIVSQASLLAVERGNIDLSIFALLVLGFFLVDRYKGRTKVVLTGVVIGVLTVLKLYPVVAATVFLRDRKGWGRAVVVGVLSIAAMLAVSGRTMITAVKNTPQLSAESYGAFPFFYVLSLHSVQALAAAIKSHHVIASAAGAALACCAIAMFSVLGGKVDGFLPALEFESARGRIAIACLSVFCFTFLMGASFEYRLIFLLGVLGYLVANLNAEKSLRYFPACLVVVLFMWMPLETHELQRQLMDGLVFAGASGWLGSTLLARVTERTAAAKARVASPVLN